MATLIDSGFLYATLDVDDKNHQRTIEVLVNLTDELGGQGIEAGAQTRQSAVPK